MATRTRLSLAAISVVVILASAAAASGRSVSLDGGRGASVLAASAPRLASVAAPARGPVPLSSRALGGAIQSAE